MNHTPRHVRWLLSVALAAVTAQAADELTRVSWQETDDLFANPGMGWQTFHCFADLDPNLQGLPSSSAYFRFYWREIEPREGAVDFARLDQLLSQAQRAGQQLCFRVMCTGSGQYMDAPQWLQDQGCKGYEFLYGNGRHWVPDFEDPRFQEAHLRLIRELGARYGQHPAVDLVDIGSVGLWGEWHMSETKLIAGGQPVPLPLPQTRLALIDAWRVAFPLKPKVMLIGDIDGLRHAVQRGCGWRADCLGDLGGFSRNWNHMRDLYPQHLHQAQAGEAWKRAPVAFESCWEMGKWKREGWDIRYILDYALSNHVSYVNNKSAPLPEGTRSEIERFLRRIGYRLVLRDLEHPKRALAGEPLAVTMRWDNVGVAPPYGDYRLAFRFSPVVGATQAPLVIVRPTSIRGWLPGAREMVESVLLPAGAPPQRYRIAIGVVDPTTRSPAVRLAISGRTPDGWYPVSELEVSRARAGGAQER